MLLAEEAESDVGQGDRAQPRDGEADERDSFFVKVTLMWKMGMMVYFSAMRLPTDSKMSNSESLPMKKNATKELAFRLNWGLP